ncbi:hypothetical protein ACFQOY_04030 [Enterococcus alcedinis]|uniref:Glycoside hydrolase family 38 N-terminal domain-containing protein n=1 Tax=Enterococcus alcedinis TaxID=1274384 RepID=A0A917N580_9ENTE|nr:glycosyl hydrolase [Enterococcus alcedinis]MBP2102999.1 hypothetical protein [Enterococcus alcedinis]GGI66528.1 hypothetical protein GCM10011482_21820 [Enterococcus alcedinis]
MTKKKMYLIHHSHTDIGYTDSQERIGRHYVDFMKQLLEFFDQIDTGKKEWDGYHYTCENYWQVEEFYRNSTKEEQKRFEQRVKEGKIEVSLTYLNMNELVDDTIQRKKFAQAKKYVDDLGVHGDSAMIADINGATWGYAEAMFESGINNFYSCLHTHHGMFPLFKKQIPFWWETKKGNKLLVWNGDHYQTANPFFITPNSDFTKQFPNGYGQAEADAQFAETEKQIFSYFDHLAKEDYPYDFIPNMISGVLTDNSAPSPRMMEVIHRWNETHGEKIELELTTLQGFFDKLRGSGIEFPTYRGDWPDWWADGSDSTPAFIKIYRAAQRKYHLTRKLDPTGELGKEEWLEGTEQQMMMFAEHSWGHAASISHPWDTEVNEADYKNSAYAVNAHTLITKNMMEILSHYGEVSPTLYRNKQFKVINPHNETVADYGKVNIDHWEEVNGSYYNYYQHGGFVEVVDVVTGEVIPSQMAPTIRGYSVAFPLTLAAKEERIVVLRTKEDALVIENSNLAIRATDNVLDIGDYPGYENRASVHKIITDFLAIYFDDNGISSMIDRKTNVELIHSSSMYRPFEGVYEVTPMTKDPGTSRRLLGRNRKGRAAKRYVAQLTDLQIVNDGPIYTVAELTYELEGTRLYQVSLKVYKDSPRMTVAVKILKQYEWAPENLYIPLPFSYGKEYTLFAEKSGGVFRPTIDQLPGTNTDYYLLNNGMTFVGKEHALVVTTKDAPLIWLGDLKHHEIELCQETSASKNRELVYSWPMNNFWETNFKADISGAYEFEYDILLVHNNTDEEDLIKQAERTNQGIINIPI